MVDIDVDSDEDATDKQLPNAGKTKYKRFNRRTAVIILLIISNLPLALYTGLIHQRGTVDVLRYLHSEVSQHGADKVDILFLMPCHSTPYYR